MINEVLQNRPPVHDRVVYSFGEELKDYEVLVTGESIAFHLDLDIA